jgi:hypothetical protein
MKKLFGFIFGYCQYCNHYFKYPKRRRMNTAYVDEESNYIISCLDCFDKIEDYWTERWEELNRDLYLGLM